MYVPREQFGPTCEFYRAIFDEVLFDDGDHIMCFAAGPERAICVHVEGELGRRAGETEPMFWVDDLGEFRSVAEASGLLPEDIGVGLQLRDPGGRPLRFITPPAS